jgi:hypothetical protein
VIECAGGNSTTTSEGGSTPQTISTCIDSAIEALNKALALRPGVGDEQIKSALDRVTQFASDRILQERFLPLDIASPDENLDTMVERFKQQQQDGSKLQQQQQRRCRRTPARGLDKLDPNTSSNNGGDRNEDNEGGSTTNPIGLPASCSSPMMESQQATSRGMAATTAPSPIFSSFSHALP